MRPLPLLLAALLLASCGGDPDNSSPDVSEQDRRVGAEQHPQLLAEFGGAYGGPEANYVGRVGERVGEAAGLGGRCTYTLVNSDVVNAFAVPGCFIYVTRGLLAIVNSEAELASVLAHELGHIVADHSQRQQRRSILRQLGVAAVGFITGSETLTRIAGQAAELFTLRYSRGQEYESDDLGIRYMQAAGYDPYEAADMLDALARHDAYLARTAGRDEASSIPEWARTHPLTESRIERARQTARDSGVADDALPEEVAAYLSEVDGLLYGDDPEQGFVLGRRFAHPVMRIGFEAPPGFTLTNSPQAILLSGPDGLRGEFAGGPLPPGGLDAYASALIARLLGEARGEVGQAEPARVSGLPALFVPVLVQSEQGPVTLTIAAYAAPGGGAYHFVLVSPGAGAPPAAAALFGSFRMLSDADVRSLRPRVIRVVTAGSGGVQGIARVVASDNPVDLLQMLNDLPDDAPVRPGERLKVVTFAR